VLADTSVSVPALLEFHPFHEVSFEAVTGKRTGLPAHAVFESYAVLTRYPAMRLSPADALAMLDDLFHRRVALSRAAVDRTLRALTRGGIAGGATYDGLIGATAVEAGLPLITRDARARRTYEAVGADVQYLG
jgi:predicted nucleic acid-binding protein